MFDIRVRILLIIKADNYNYLWQLTYYYVVIIMLFMISIPKKGMTSHVDGRCCQWYQRCIWIVGVLTILNASTHGDGSSRIIETMHLHLLLLRARA